MIRFVILSLFLQILLFRTGIFPSVVSPATGDPVVVILAVLGVSAVAQDGKTRRYAPSTGPKKAVPSAATDGKASRQCCLKGVG